MTGPIDVYLVRHGEAAVPWSEAQDAGLSELGREQAETVARELAPLQHLALISSPLLRAQETAIPLGRHWGRAASIDERYREVPLSTSNARRKAWLSEVAHARWADVDSVIIAWRNAAWEGLLTLEHSAIIFTHFMLINALVSRATAAESLVCFEPDYASVTHLRLTSDDCKVIAFGRST